MRVVSFKIPEELWNKFYSKFKKNSHEKLRELIKKEVKEAKQK